MSLEFIERRDKSKAGHPRALYRCDCGKEFVAQVGNVKSGNTTSCGCGRGTHRQTKSPLYCAWTNMRQRVTNRAVYPTYEGVGCDERWLTFEGFLANQPAGRPYEPGLCLSRFGDTGDYTPENTRWLTRQENSSEQRHTPKTHCINGHPYTEENTTHVTNRKVCRTCAQQRNREYRTRQRDRRAGASGE